MIESTVIVKGVRRSGNPDYNALDNRRKASARSFRYREPA